MRSEIRMRETYFCKPIYSHMRVGILQDALSKKDEADCETNQKDAARPAGWPQKKSRQAVHEISRYAFSRSNYGSLTSGIRRLDNHNPDFAKMRRRLGILRLFLRVNAKGKSESSPSFQPARLISRKYEKEDGIRRAQTCGGPAKKGEAARKSA